MEQYEKYLKAERALSSAKEWNDYALTTIFSVEEAEIVQSFTAMLMERLANEIEENFLRRRNNV